MKWLVGLTVGCLAFAAFLWIGMTRADPPSVVPAQSQEAVSAETPAPPRNTSEGYSDWLGEQYAEAERANARDRQIYDYIDEQIAEHAEPSITLGDVLH